MRNRINEDVSRISQWVVILEKIKHSDTEFYYYYSEEKHELEIASDDERGMNVWYVVLYHRRIWKARNKLLDMSFRGMIQDEVFEAKDKELRDKIHKVKQVNKDTQERD